MKKFFAIAISLIMMVGMLTACGDDTVSSSNVTHVGGVDGPSSVSVDATTSETASYEVIDPVSLGDTLTAEIEGDWMVTGIYQTAKVSDRTEDEALSQEKSKAVHIGSDFFEYYGGRVDIPYYKFTTVTAQQMEIEGFFADSIAADFSDGANCLEVYQQNGTDLCATFYIKGDNLVYFGAGGYIFTCSKTAAVG